jgi:hypothetical protein
MPWIEYAFQAEIAALAQGRLTADPGAPIAPFPSGISPSMEEPSMAPRVLVSDELSETAVQIFRDRGVEVDYMPKLGKDKESWPRSSAI